MELTDAGLRDSSQFISNTFRQALVPAILSIRILIAPEQDRASIILRIRCSGIPSNPIACYKRHKEETAAPQDALDDLPLGLDDSLGIA